MDTLFCLSGLGVPKNCLKESVPAFDHVLLTTTPLDELRTWKGKVLLNCKPTFGQNQILIERERDLRRYYIVGEESLNDLLTMRVHSSSGVGLPVSSQYDLDIVVPKFMKLHENFDKLFLVIDPVQNFSIPKYGLWWCDSCDAYLSRVTTKRQCCPRCKEKALWINTLDWVILTKPNKIIEAQLKTAKIDYVVDEN